MLAVLLAAETVAFFRMQGCLPFCAFPGDFLLNFFFPPVVLVSIGDTLNEGPGIECCGCVSSMGVDVSSFCVFVVELVSSLLAFRLWCCTTLGGVGCLVFMGFSPIWGVLSRCAFSAKQNFSILRLFRLYSPIVLQATKFMRRSFGSCGAGRVSEDIAMSLLRITVFLRL